MTRPPRSWHSATVWRGAGLAVALLAALVPSSSAQQATDGAALAPSAAPPSEPVDNPVDTIVVTGMIPVPDVGEGAPYFTPQDLELVERATRTVAAQSSVDARKCQTGAFPKFASAFTPTLEVTLRSEVDAARKVANLSARAAEATRVAEQARRDVASGAALMPVAEAAEIERQSAVRSLQKAQEDLLEARNATADLQDILMRGRDDDVSWGELDFRAERRRRENPETHAKEFEGLEISGVEAEEFTDRKGAFVRITGVVTNRRDKTATVPAILAAIVDANGWVLASERVEPKSAVRLRPGASQKIAIDLRSVSDKMNSVAVVFSSRIAAPPRQSVQRFADCNRSFGQPEEDSGD